MHILTDKIFKQKISDFEKEVMDKNKSDADILHLYERLWNDATIEDDEIEEPTKNAAKDLIEKHRKELYEYSDDFKDRF